MESSDEEDGYVSDDPTHTMCEAMNCHMCCYFTMCSENSWDHGLSDDGAQYITCRVCHPNGPTWTATPRWRRWWLRKTKEDAHRRALEECRAHGDARGVALMLTSIAELPPAIPLTKRDHLEYRAATLRRNISLRTMQLGEVPERDAEHTEALHRLRQEHARAVAALA